MPGTRDGSETTAAIRVGVTLEEYRAKVAQGLKWCTGCKLWKMREEYGADKSRGDGLAARCTACRRVKSRAARVGGPPDQRTATLATEAVRKAVRQGRLAPIRSLKCRDCGKVARHYHHHLGYARTHWLDVIALCVGCHRRRHLG